jgi:teichuronic acid biosynthesis glycosyltransferase TuaG
VIYNKNGIPKVSIIIPYYKKRAFFKKCIDSIVSQDFQNYEVIIVYDDKELKDLKFIKKLIKNKKKIRIILNKNNIGAANSRNKGILNSKGEYIAFIDADDFWSKKKLSTQLSVMETKGYAFTHTNYVVIKKKKILQTRKAKLLNYKKLLNSCDIGLSTVMIRKNLLFKKKNFPSISTKEDYVLWLKILRHKTEFIYPINMNLTFWQITEKSLSSDNFQKILDGYRVYRKFMGFNKFFSVYRLIILIFNFLWKKII